MKAIKDKYRKMKEDHNSRQIEKTLLSIEEARQNRLITDWQSEKLSAPEKPGLHVIEEFDLNELTKYIDWTFFFYAWKLNGKYPAIFEDPVKGEEARKLFDDAHKYLREIKEKKLLKANGVFGLFPAVSEGDDVKVLSEKTRMKLKQYSGF